MLFGFCTNGKRKIINFEELKSCSFNDFLAFEKFRNDSLGGVEYIKNVTKLITIRCRNNYYVLVWIVPLLYL